MVNMLHVQNITLALITAAMGKYTVGSEVVTEVVHPTNEFAEMSIDEHNAYLEQVAKWCVAKRLPPLTSLVCRDGIAAPGFWLAYPELKAAEDKKTVAQAMTKHFHNQCFEFFDGVGVANDALMLHIEERIDALRLFAERHHEPLPLNALVRYCDSIGVKGVTTGIDAKLDVPILQRPALADWLKSHIYFGENGCVTGWDTHNIQSDEDRNTITRSGVVMIGKKTDILGSLLKDVVGKHMFEFRQLEVKGLLFEDNSARPGSYTTVYTGPANGGGHRGWVYTVTEQLPPNSTLARETDVVAEATLDPERGTFMAHTQLAGITALIIEVKVVATPLQ